VTFEVRNKLKMNLNIFSKTNNLIKCAATLARFYSVKPTEEIKQLVGNNKVVVFMKGVPEQPRCGFSNAVVQILRMHGVPYDAHDVLADESLRQGDYNGAIKKNCSMTRM
jgi:hypothetical protein